MKALQLFLIIVMSSTSTWAADNSAAIRDTFDTYKRAILNDQGTVAYATVDKRTRHSFNRFLRLSIDANEEDIMRLNFIDKMMVIMCRHRIPNNVLVSMDGKALFEYSVERGWVGKDGATNIDIGKIQINDQFAIAQVISLRTSEVTSMKFHFYKENGSWKIDLTKVLEYGALAMRQLQQQSQLSEVDFIFEALEMIGANKVNRNTIYNPIKRRSPSRLNFEFVKPSDTPDD